MKNDTYYFSHDSNAKDDPKCVMLIEQLGCEGYGIFWILIETLRAQPDYKYPLNLVGALARRYNTSAEKMTTVVKSYGLFKIEEELFFSLRLMRAMDEYNAKKLKYIQAGSKGGQASVKHRLSNCQAIKGNKIKGNKIKGKEIKRKEKNGDSTGPVFVFSNKGFFDRQLKNNEGQPDIDKYRKLVEFLHKKDDDGEYEFKNVLSLSKQISFKDYQALKETETQHGLRNLKEVLEAMENKKDLTKDYKNVYLTAKAWLKNEFK